MSDASMLAIASLLILSFLSGWFAGRTGMVDPLRPREESFPLPLALRLTDKARRPGKRRWRS